LNPGGSGCGLSAIAGVPNAKAKAQTADNNKQFARVMVISSRCEAAKSGFKPLQHFTLSAFSDGKPDSTRDQAEGTLFPENAPMPRMISRRIRRDGSALQAACFHVDCERDAHLEWAKELRDGGNCSCPLVPASAGMSGDFS
jgi:hypothetical protein